MCVGFWKTVWSQWEVMGIKVERLSFIVFIPMTSKQKISFSVSDQTIIYTISIFFQEKCTCCIVFFSPLPASAAHVEHGCTCCQCILSTCRKRAPPSWPPPKKNKNKKHTQALKVFNQSYVFIWNAQVFRLVWRIFIAVLALNSNLSVLLSDMLAVAALWCFMAALTHR